MVNKKNDNYCVIMLIHAGSFYTVPTSRSLQNDDNEEILMTFCTDLDVETV